MDKRDSMKNQRWPACILVLAAFTAIICMFFRPAAYPAVKAAAAQWRAAWISGAPELIYQENEETDYQSGQANEDSAKRPPIGTQYGQISCEKFDGKIPLYYGDSEEILELGAGTYTGYGFLGEQQRVLIGAHDSTYFAKLDELKTGDKITLVTVYGSYQYRVVKTDIVDVAEAQAKIQEESVPGLILYTCYPIGKTDKPRTERYLVFADAVDMY